MHHVKTQPIDQNPIHEAFLFVDADWLAARTPYSSGAIVKLAKDGFLPYYKDINAESLKPRIMFSPYEVLEEIKALKVKATVGAAKSPRKELKPLPSSMKFSIPPTDLLNHLGKVKQKQKNI